MRRTAYVLRHLEPTGFRISLYGLITVPILLGLQFILLPDAHWNQPLYEPIKAILSIRVFGVLWLVHSLWMVLQVRLFPTRVLTWTLMYSSFWWLFWSVLSTLASIKTGGTFIGATLFFGMAWWTFAASQTLAQGQVKVNGPRAREFR